MTEGPEIHIREDIHPHDRHRIFNLLSASGRFLPREMAYGMDLFDEHLLKGDMSHYRFMLYEQDGMLLAYGCYGPLRLTDRRYHLHWLAVDHNSQNKGLGHRLEKAIADKIQKEGGLKIYAEISNRDYHTDGRAFYKRCGYEPLATVADYYGDGDDMVLYVKDLTAPTKT